MQATSPPSFVPKRFGKYLLLERIGRGGMAEVYRSKTFGTAGFVKECAIKKILSSLLDDDQFVQMFVDEAKLTAFLTHPNIVQVLDLGEIDGHLFISMEYVAGKDLLDLLARSARRGIRIPVEIALYVATEMLAGLDFAHNAVDARSEAMGIVHRDVSPSNILISYDGQVKVGDFGIAKSQMQSSKTEVGTQKGKTGYMSPEQVTGAPIDRRSDLFAAAVILFEMLTMTRLFKAKNDLDVMLKIRDADIEADLERASRVSPGLADIIRKGLAKDPDTRFQTAGEFRDALRAYVQDRRITLNASELSAFICDLFSDKIAAEKARRLNDPSAADGYESIIEPNGAHLRYRDRNRVIHGPMTAAMMVELLGSRPAHAREAISFDGGPWTPVPEFAEFADVERADHSDLGDSGEMSGVSLRMTQGGHDWESLAGISRGAKRRLRARKAKSESREINPDARPRRAKVDTRETAAVDSGASPRTRRGDHQTRPRLRPSESGASPMIARTPISQSTVAARPRASTSSSPRIAPRNSTTTTESSVVESRRTDLVVTPVSNGTSGSRRATGPPNPRRGSPAAGRASVPSATFTPPPVDAVSLPHPPVPATSVPPGAVAELLDEENAIAELARPNPPSLSDEGPVPGPPTHQGEIGEVSVCRVAHRIGFHQLSGQLRVSSGSLAKHLSFQDGALVGADSNDRADEIVELLRSRDVITRQQAEDAATAAAQTGGRVEDELLRQGALAPHALFHFMQEQLAEKLLGCAFWEEGSWSWYADEASAGSAPTNVPLPDLLARGIAHDAPSRYLRRFYKSRRRTPLVALLSGDALKPLKLSARALRIVTELDQTRTVADVVRRYCDRYGWPEAEVYRSLYALTEFEVIGFEGANAVDLPG